MNDDQIDLLDVAATLRRRWIWLLLPLLLAPIAGISVKIREEIYTARAAVLIDDSNAFDLLGTGFDSPDIAARRVETQVVRASGDVTLGFVEEILGPNPPAVRITGDPESDVLYFDAEASTAAEAEAIADAWAVGYLSSRNAQTQASILQAEVVLRNRISALAAERRALEAQGTDKGTELAVIDFQIKTVSENLSRLGLAGDLAQDGDYAGSLQSSDAVRLSASLLKNTIVGVIVGLMAGLGLALAVDVLDKSIRTAADASKISGLEVMGVIPSPETFDRPIGAKNAIEAYASLRNALGFRASVRNATTIIFTSPGRSCGTSSVVANLARSFAESDMTVGVIDADLREGSLHHVFDSRESTGLLGHLDTGTSVDELLVVQDSPYENVEFMPAGGTATDAAQLVLKAEFLDAITAVAKSNEIVLIDSPAVLRIADAMVIARAADLTILVVRLGETSAEELKIAASRLSSVNGGAVALVVTGADIEK